MNEEEELTDVEERRKYDERVQKEYEENKYRNRELQKKQQEGRQLDIPGLFEARSGLRTTAALGTEIFLNTLVDPFFEPGTQVAAGTAINWLAQRIRGGELSKGELAAAGLASLIPGGAQGRAVTQFAKGLGKGGLAGGIESIGMAGIDRGELPTLTEFATSVGIGAAFGGALSTPQATKALQDLRGRIKGQYTPIVVEAMSPQPSLGGAGLRTVKVKQSIDSGKGNFKLLSDAQKQEAKSIVDDLDAFFEAGQQGKIAGWTAMRPTTRYRGNRTLPYTRKDGSAGRLYFNWSKSQDTFKATDLDKLIATRLKRKKWNINSDLDRKKQADAIYTSARQANARVKQSLKILETTDPELFQEIIGGNQIWYVEHIHAQNSPYWNKERPFKPRDPENIIAIGDDIFPKMKTAVEKIIYTDPKYKGKIYLDYDRSSRDLILRDANTDEVIGSAIPGITNTRDAKEAFLRALSGKDPLKLAEINPDLRKFIDFEDEISASIARQKPDVDSSGLTPQEVDRFSDYRDELERLQTQLQASQTGIGKVLNAQAQSRIKNRIKFLQKYLDQLSIFDTGAAGTGLRTQVKPKPKPTKAAKVKKTKINPDG
tara:strand:+ start:84 stop:1883 length:1800 start_codon:yes stop_codon:yes gene_type:complete